MLRNNLKIKKNCSDISDIFDLIFFYGHLLRKGNFYGILRNIFQQGKVRINNNIGIKSSFVKEMAMTTRTTKCNTF